MRRRGVTLVEVVLVLILIATLIGFLLPASVEMRDRSSFRTQSNNNLKQCVLAVHNFHDTFRRLPDAFAVGGSYPKDPKSLWFHLLPYVEADHVYKQNATNGVVAAFCAPSDASNIAPAGVVNFAANLRIFAHNTLGKDQANAVGVAVVVPRAGTTASSNLTLPRIIDGTSNVIMLTTRYAICSNMTTRYAAEPAKGGGFFGAGSHAKPANARGNDNDLMYQIAPSNFNGAPTQCNPTPGLYGHSFSQSGLIVALADGTLRTITPRMSPTTFARALCPGDQQQLGEDWVDD